MNRQSSSNLSDALARQLCSPEQDLGWVGTEDQCQRHVSNSIYKAAEDGTDDDINKIVAKGLAEALVENQPQHLQWDCTSLGKQACIEKVTTSIFDGINPNQ